MGVIREDAGDDADAKDAEEGGGNDEAQEDVAVPAPAIVGLDCRLVTLAPATAVVRNVAVEDCDSGCVVSCDDNCSPSRALSRNGGEDDSIREEWSLPPPLLTRSIGSSFRLMRQVP